LFDAGLKLVDPFEQQLHSLVVDDRGLPVLLAAERRDTGQKQKYQHREPARPIFKNHFCHQLPPGSAAGLLNDRLQNLGRRCCTSKANFSRSLSSEHLINSRSKNH
jgi:hypothetical protein